MRGICPLENLPDVRGISQDGKSSGSAAYPPSPATDEPTSYSSSRASSEARISPTALI